MTYSSYIKHLNNSIPDKSKTNHGKMIGNSYRWKKIQHYIVHEMFMMIPDPSLHRPL
jgi:hypothetical protein